MNKHITSDDPLKSPDNQDTVMGCRIGIIAFRLSKLLNISAMRAMKLFYQSNTCKHFHDKATGLYLRGEYYIADEFILEMQAKQNF